MKKYVGFLLLISCLGCKLMPKEKKETKVYPHTGTIERLDPALDTIISREAQPEIIVEGMDWSEGPLWVDQYKMLLFSDVPRDTIFKWTEAKGKEIYLTPSGYTDTLPRGGEMGSNGLTLDNQGRLILCQCGNRQIARMAAPLDKPLPQYASLANNYMGKKFNSPNDVIVSSKGEVFFTDPAYGLEKQMDDPKKELPFQGVYRVNAAGKVSLVTDSLTRPNGILLLPGEKTLLVANSDEGDRAAWYAFDVLPDTVLNGRKFLGTAGSGKDQIGAPDGMKVTRGGIIFAAGPGGIWIFDTNAKVLGKIHLQNQASNVALSADEKTLYITNDGYVLRLKMKP